MEQKIQDFIQSHNSNSIVLHFQNYYHFQFIPQSFSNDFLKLFQQKKYNVSTSINSNHKLILKHFNVSLYYHSNKKHSNKIEQYIDKNNTIIYILPPKIDLILQTINEFNILYFQHHYNNIIKNPVLLNNINQIKKNYSVTDKADGKRNLLLFYNNQSHLISSEKTIVYNTKNKLDKYLTLLDGEYLPSLNTFLVFDGLFINGQCIQDFNLINRLKFIEIFITNIENNDIIIKLKKFYYGDEYKDLCQNAYKLYHKNYDYHLDGLIYTPIDEPYYNRSKTTKETYKWKPLNENSIDFLVIELENNNYGLVVSTSYKNSNKEFNNKYFPWVKRDSYPKLFYTQSFNKYKKIKEYKNKIVEMTYDFKNKIFTVMRIREDKMANYENYKKDGIFRGPNGFKTALNTFQYIKHPIKDNLILCSSSNYWNNRKNYSNKINSIKKFHGSVKRNLYNTYLQKFNDPYVLEIGSGRGGDLNKLKINGVKYVLMTNINKGGINEAQIRYESMNSKNFKVDFLVENSSKNITNKIEPFIKNKNRNIHSFFDIVSIQFALHYFLKTKTTFQHFFNNINTFLKKNGYIIATFLDGDSLNLLLKKKEKIYFNGSDQKPLFTIEKKYKKYNNYGSTILVTGKTIGSHEEYLVNIQFLTSFFEKHNYKVIDTQLFSTQSGFKDMKNGADYSSINRFIILQKL